MRAIIDTNIVVSGLLFGGLPLRIIDAGLKRKFTWVASPDIIDEYERVLGAKKFGLSKSDVESLLTPILELLEIVTPDIKINAIPRCPGDNRVLECAVCGKCNVIVTGDRRDLLCLVKFQDVQIMKARDFLVSFR